MKDFLKNLINRLRPRKTFRWVFIFIFWILVLIYLGVGVFEGIRIYKLKNNDQLTKNISIFYPFPAAFADGRPIWVKDYYRQNTYIECFTQKTQQVVADEATLMTQIINQLVENKILEMQALKYSVNVSSKDVNEAYQKIIDQAGGRAEVKKVLRDLYCMSEREMKALVKDQVLKEKIRSEIISQVKVFHILIKDENRAKEIYDRAKNGEDFAALAKQYSEDIKSRDSGGELEWAARGEITADGKPVPEFDEAVFAANPGDLVGPIKTSAGFEIIKIDKKKGQISQNFTDWLSELKNKTKVWRLLK